MIDLPAGLIDIHCHLLHGLDDGPQTLQAAAHMCRVAHAAGTVAVISTPHANHRFCFDPQKTAELCESLREQIPPALRLFAGCELELSLETLPDALRDIRRYTLNGSRYLLVELLKTGMPPNLEQVLARFLDQGVTPILAHPERSAHLQHHLDKLSSWVERGCLAQLTGDALTGRMGPRLQTAALEVLRRRLAHFVASDGHDPIRRPPRLLEAYRTVGERLSPALAALLFISNPLAVIENRPIRAWPAF